MWTDKTLLFLLRASDKEINGFLIKYKQVNVCAKVCYVFSKFCLKTNKNNNSGLEFTGLLLLNLNLKAWSNVPFVLTFVHVEYLIWKHFWDRGWMKKHCKADITGGSIFQSAHRRPNLHSNHHSNSWEMCLLCSRFVILLCTTIPQLPCQSQERTGGKKQMHWLSSKSRVTNLCFPHLPLLTEHTLDSIDHSYSSCPLHGLVLA